jgi:hypothetical protein
VIDIIKLIQTPDTDLANLLLSRTACILDIESSYADNLLLELQGSVKGTEEVLQLKLLDQLMIVCGHRLLERCTANDLEELVSKIAYEDTGIAGIAAKLIETRTILRSQGTWQTKGHLN